MKYFSSSERFIRFTSIIHRRGGIFSALHTATVGVCKGGIFSAPTVNYQRIISLMRNFFLRDEKFYSSVRKEITIKIKTAII